MHAEQFFRLRPPPFLPRAVDRRLLRDAGIALLVAVAACVQLRTEAVSGTGLVHSYPVAAAIAVGASATLVLRRRRPELCLLAGLVASFASDERTLLIAAAYAATRYGGQRRRALVAATAVAYVATRYSIGMAAHSYQQLLYGVVVEIGFPAVLGGLARHQRELRDLLRERLDRAEDTVRSATRFALLEERTRLAFDIHDHIGHEVTFLVLRAGSLQRVPGLPEDAHTAAVAVQESAERVMADLRQMLGTLRDTSGKHTTPTGPASCAEFLSGLVRNMSKAGLAAEYRLHGVARPLPPATEQLLYCLCREAFTNAVKYAPGAAVRAELTFATGLVSLEVRNGRPSGVAPLHSSGRMGLAGLRERVERADGRLSAGPLRDGGFRLLAALPTPPPAGDEPAVTGDPARPEQERSGNSRYQGAWAA